MIVLDTDHVSVLQHRNSPLADSLRGHFATVPTDEVATSAITVEEQLRGWLALIGRYTDPRRQVPYYERLLSLFDFFARWLLLPFDERAAAEFQRLRSSGIRVGTMDLKIASIVLVHRATLLSSNTSDFARVPGLRVENWLHG